MADKFRVRYEKSGQYLSWGLGGHPQVEQAGMENTYATRREAKAKAKIAGLEGPFSIESVPNDRANDPHRRA